MFCLAKALQGRMFMNHFQLEVLDLFRFEKDSVIIVKSSLGIITDWSHIMVFRDVSVFLEKFHKEDMKTAYSKKLYCSR